MARMNLDPRPHSWPLALALTAAAVGIALLFLVIWVLPL
jgi:hypothetical protein